MLNEKLFEYIKQEVKKGVDKEKIKNALLQKGWDQEVIAEAFSQLSQFNYSEHSSTSSASIDNKLEQQKKQSTLTPGEAMIFNDFLSPSELFEKAYQIYKNKFNVLLSLSLVYAFSVIVPQLIVFGYLNLTHQFTTAQPATFGFAILLAIIATIIGLLSKVAMFYVIKDKKDKQNNITLYLKMSLKIFPAYLLVMFFTGLVIAGGIIMFIIPGIIFSVWFSLSAFVLINEDARGFNALKKSKAYVNGYWWRVFWRYVMLDFAFFGIIFIGTLIILVPIKLIGFDSAKANMINSFVKSLIGVFFTPLWIAYRYLIYKNLQALKRQ